MLPPLRETLTETAAALALGSQRFRLLGPYEYESVLRVVTEQFLDVGTRGLDYHWWWEHLKGNTASFQTHSAYKLLPKLLPADQALWFIAEDGTKKNACFWVYEADADAIIQMLAESRRFEYYVVSKKRDWLLCENHHEVLTAVGESMTEALNREKTRRLTLPAS